MDAATKTNGERIDPWTSEACGPPVPSLRHRCDARFAELLSGFDVQALERSEDVVLGVWSDLRIAYTNPVWYRFAAANGGDAILAGDWGLGRSLMDAVPAPLQTAYRVLYQEAAEHGRRPSHIDYSCDAPEVRRRFRQLVYPLSSGTAAGLLLVNAPISSERPDETTREAVEAEYRDADGFITQCAHCRRSRRVTVEEWVWIPAWVERMPDRTSHSLCPPCLGHYYPAGPTSGTGAA